MKQFYLFTLILACSGFSFAQNFTYSTDQHLETENVSGNYETYDIEFTTVQPQDITFGWTLISNSLPVGWTYSLCDYTGCYSGIPASGTMTAISQSQAQSGTKGFFKLNLSPLNITGDGVVEIFVFDSSNPSVGDTVSFHIWHTSATADLIDLNETKPLVYPNPAKDVLHISPNAESGSIVNVLGQKVLTIKANSNQTIDVSSWKTGVYFYVTRVNGQSITTRFVVQ